MLNRWNTSFGPQKCYQLFPAISYFASFLFPLSIRWNVSLYSFICARHSAAFCCISYSPPCPLPSHQSILLLQKNCPVMI